MRLFLAAAHLLVLTLPGRSQTPPPSFQLGGVVFRPSGFLENIAEYRTATTPDTVYTKFGAIPLGNSSGQMLDSFRHSRLGLDANRGALAGYIEIDFLNSPENQPLRWRQYWGEFSRGNWRILGGQAWSLLRPNRTGTSSETGLMNTLAVDPAYHVGLVGLRKRQIRVTRQLGAWQVVVAYEYQKGGDLLAKVVRDSHRMHLEAVALAGHGRRLGGSLAGVLHASQRVNIVSQQSWLQGAGPEALNTLPPRVHASTTLQGVEANVLKSLTLFAYGGLVYGTRSTGNRTVREWSAGFHQQLFRRPSYGTAVLAGQYSQIDRALWTGPSGAMNFVMLSLRYSVR